MPFFPGPGYGGHCIPIDPFYLSWKAKQLGVNTKFIELAGEINNKMPLRVVDKGVSILEKEDLQIENAKILLLGLAYKKDVDDYFKNINSEYEIIKKNLEGFF